MAGSVVREAYVDLFSGTDHEAYLEELADVDGRVTRTTVLVALAAGVIVGSVSVELTGRVDAEPRRLLADGEAHLRMLAVAPAAQGRGVGRALVEESIALARASGKTRITLNTMPEMVAAQRLYISAGFRRAPDRLLDSGRCMFSYELDLQPGPRLTSAESGSEVTDQTRSQPLRDALRRDSGPSL